MFALMEKVFLLPYHNALRFVYVWVLLHSAFVYACVRVRVCVHVCVCVRVGGWVGVCFAWFALFDLSLAFLWFTFLLSCDRRALPVALYQIRRIKEREGGNRGRRAVLTGEGGQQKKEKKRESGESGEREKRRKKKRAH